MTKLSVTIFFLLTTLAVLGGCGKREEPALATSQSTSDWIGRNGGIDYSISCFKGQRVILGNRFGVFYELNKEGKPVPCQPKEPT